VADNVTLNAGSGGAVVATDDDSTAQHQYVKVEFGGDGTFTKVADSDGSRLPVKEAKAATGTESQVADNAAAVTILAANTARKGALIHNTSTVNLYLRLGNTAPTTSDFSTVVPPDQTYEVPVCYAGIIKGIWASDPNTGNANVTEFS
jgi:hypothetical protein